MNLRILNIFGIRYKTSNFATISRNSQNQNTMKINFKLFGMGLLLMGALVATSCQDSAEGTNDETRESVVAEDNADQTTQTNQSAQVTEVSAGENASAEDVDPNAPTTTMSFAEEVYDFGSVEKGGKVEHSYKFTNTGNEPLIISNAKASCGCTVPTWPKEPIAPGETGEIPVIFNAKSTGNQTKTITITANTTPPKTRLTIKGQVTDASES